MRKVKKLMLSMLIIGMALVMLVGLPARPVLADKPEVTTQVITATNVPYFMPGVTCGDFTILATFTLERRNTLFRDENGQLLVEKARASFTGTLTNSVTGKSLPYEGRFTRTTDFEDNTVTFTGLIRQTLVPGEGVILLETGRRVIDRITRDELFVAGQHEFDSQICSVLAE